MQDSILHRQPGEKTQDGGKAGVGVGAGGVSSWESGCPSCVTLGFVCGFPMLPSLHLQHGGEVGDGGFTASTLQASELRITVLLI